MLAKDWLYGENIADNAAMLPVLQEDECYCVRYYRKDNPPANRVGQLTCDQEKINNLNHHIYEQFKIVADCDWIVQYNLKHQ